MKHDQSENKALCREHRSVAGQMARGLVNGVVSMLPQMDPEVAMRALDQFPSFADACSTIIGSLRDGLGTTEDRNAANMDAFNTQTREALNALEAELAKDDLSDEGRRQVVEGILSIIKEVGQRDTANKEFLSGLFQGVLIAAVVTIICVGVPLGLKLNLPSGIA